MFADNNFIEKKAIEMMMDKYIGDITNKCKDEVFVVFDLINKQYKETGECPIHKEGSWGEFTCGEVKVATNNNYFIVGNEPVQLIINANYCPICGKKLGE